MLFSNRRILISGNDRILNRRYLLILEKISMCNQMVTSEIRE